MAGLTAWLTKQKEAGTCRELFPLERKPGGLIKSVYAEPDTAWSIDFSSNDYLALAEHPALINRAQDYLERYGTGAGAARLMSGNLAIYHELESRVARLKGQESALLFGSGYMANVGILPALVGKGDVIFTDRLNHASIYDGSLLSGARMVRFLHNDPVDLGQKLAKERGTGQALIVVESIYSMDGDRAPLQELVELKNRYSCLLMVDEAHATGIFGKNGGGVIQEDGVAADVDLAMGTFGKALGSYGAYVAGRRQMIEFLINRARSFIYTTALPPAVIGASLAAVDLIEKEPALRSELASRVNLFKKSLAGAGLAGSPGPSQIVPILIGDSGKAYAIAQELRKNQIHATAIRPPTVPPGTARLRFSVTLHHSPKALPSLAKKIVDIVSSMAPEASL